MVSHISWNEIRHPSLPVSSTIPFLKPSFLRHSATPFFPRPGNISISRARPYRSSARVQADEIDDYCEELLAEHETYIEQLRAEIESKANLLPKVREWHALVVDEDELERAQTDPDRFKRRGGAMLREEKLRKRVTVAKPRVSSPFCIL